MPAYRPGQEPHQRPAEPDAGPRPGRGRLALTLAAVTCGLLASAAVVPAAFAVADPGGYGGTSITPAPAPVRVVAAGGMAGWQITLIALGAAVLAAAAAVFADRALTARRAGPATTARRLRPTRAQHHPGVPGPGADPADQAVGSQDRHLPSAAPAPGTLDIADFDSHLI